MPSGRSPPGFGIVVRRTGSGRYVFETSSSPKPGNQISTPDASIASKGHPVNARRSRIVAGQRAFAASSPNGTRNPGEARASFPEVKSTENSA